MTTFDIERLKLSGLDLNVPEVAQVTNLATNPSFETATTTWGQTAASGSFARTAVADAPAGAYVLRQTNPGSNANEGVYAGSYAAIASNPHTASVWVRVASGTLDMILSISEFTSGDVLVGSTTQAFTATTAWQRVTVTRTFGATGVKAQVNVYRSAAVAAVFDVDGLLLQQNNVDVAYFDGDSPGYEWSGTAHASSSRPAPRITLLEFDWKPAKKLLEWVKSADADGQKLVRPPKHDNAQMDLVLQVGPEASMDDAIDVTAEIVAKLQDAEQAAVQGRGSELVVTPTNSTYSGTVYVQAGEVEEVPRDIASGYPFKAPRLKVRLDCHPFIYDDAVTSSTTTASDALITKLLTGVEGDVPAEATVTVTDAATQSRDWIAVGVEHRHYSADILAALYWQAPSMLVAGYAGASNTRTGSVGLSIIRATLTTFPVAVCASPGLVHAGTFRNRFRLYATSTGVRVRLAWRAGRGQWHHNPYVELPGANQWCEPDLGLVTIPATDFGTQEWEWRLEAYSPTAGDTIDVDLHELLPAGEGFQKARAVQPFATATSFSARDEFDQTAGALTGKTLPAGGTWAGAGDADDFAVEATGHTAERTATGDASFATGRFVTASTPTPTATGVQVDVKTSVLVTNVALGVLARYADTSNYLLAKITALATSPAQLDLTKVVAASATNLGGTVTQGVPLTVGLYTTIRLVVDVAGRYYLWAFSTGGNPGAPLIAGQDSALATGGALASGKVGMFDANLTTAATRNYDNFQAFVPETDAACFSGQSVQFYSDGDHAALREDSTGVYSGEPGEVLGSRIWIPPGGTTRLAVMARRNDIDTLPSNDVTDSTQVAVTTRARRLVFPG